MNVNEARGVLSGKLIFGDAKQVEAVRYLQAVNECVDAIQSCRETHHEKNKKRCSQCSGTGECRCDCGDEHDCQKCDGSGSITSDNLAYCSCIQEFKGDIAREAFQEFARQVEDKRMTILESTMRSMGKQ